MSPKEMRKQANTSGGRTLPRLSASQAIGDIKDMKSEININNSRNAITRNFD